MGSYVDVGSYLSQQQVGESPPKHELFESEGSPVSVVMLSSVILLKELVVGETAVGLANLH